MFMSGTYKDLEVWQSAMELAVQVYRLTAMFPKEERYGLTSQMRRAAVSVPSNIAEGKGRSSDKELIQFLCHSRGSLFEIETQLEIGEQLGYSKTEDCDAIRRETARIGQMINGLIRSVSPRSAAA
jgi:four helix bundle protein